MQRNHFRQVALFLREKGLNTRFCRLSQDVKTKVDITRTIDFDIVIYIRT